MMLVRSLVIAAVVLPAPRLLANRTISLLEPSNHAVLRGGSVATIAWKATGPLPTGAVEWEAFLSVNGGVFYSARLTPHLDIDIRSFTFRVPNVASKSVRLLFRVGDEREEHSFELDQQFSIVAVDELPPLFSVLPKSEAEAARPGDAPVIKWASGDRRGRAVVEERAPHPPQLFPTRFVKSVFISHAVASTAFFNLRDSRPLLTRLSIDGHRPHLDSPAFRRDILLLVRRLNI